jgi:hypothetical protein
MDFTFFQNVRDDYGNPALPLPQPTSVNTSFPFHFLLDNSSIAHVSCMEETI